MQNMILPLLVASFVAACASLLGSFAILKRMALVGDAMSHVALPGLALAMMFKVNPFIGGVLFLIVAVVGIWLIQHKTSLSIDTVVGVFFTSSLAIGALIMPEQELIEALFGNIMELSSYEAAASILLSLVLIGTIIALHKRLALCMVSSEIAHSIGVNTRRLDFIYLMAFALAVALGIRFVGALLMGSLVIIPAASAKNMARSLNSFMALSVIFGVFAAALGIFVSYSYGLSPGPVFIIISAGIFAVSLFARGSSRSPA